MRVDCWLAFLDFGVGEGSCERARFREHANSRRMPARMPEKQTPSEEAKRRAKRRAFLVSADPYLTCSRFRIHTASPTLGLGHRAFSMPTTAEEAAAPTFSDMAWPRKLEYATNVLAWEAAHAALPAWRSAAQGGALLFR